MREACCVWPGAVPGLSIHPKPVCPQRNRVSQRFSNSDYGYCQPVRESRLVPTLSECGGLDSAAGDPGFKSRLLRYVSRHSCCGKQPGRSSKR